MLLFGSNKGKVFKYLKIFRDMKEEINLDEEYEKYKHNKRWLVRVERTGLPQDSFDEQLGVKKDLLRAYGYDVLRARGERFLPLNECSGARITHVLNATYENAQSQIRKFGEAVRNSEEYRNLVGLIEAEQDLEGVDSEEAQERTATVMDRSSEYVLGELSRQCGSEVMGGYYVGNGD